jgi:L-Ala-D/L-Glu epimerase
MSRIAKLEVIPYRLPLRGALSWGKHGKLEAAEHALIRVTLENGVSGVAEAPPRPTIYGETIASVQGIVKHLEPSLTTLEIDDTDGIKNVLSSVPNNNCAKGALDMALWDARVKNKGQTLFDALAGPKTGLETSFILGIADHDTMLEEAKRIVAAGVRVLKVKVGRNTAHDLEVIRALRTEFGETVKLYADSNETLEPQNAPKALESMREAGLLYVEEPLPVRQIKARAELKRLQILPIIADDSCFTPADLLRELEFDTFDILNIKTARNGFTDSLEMMQMASSVGKGIMIGSQASTTLGTIHAAIISSRAAVTHPCELSFFLKLERDITNRTPKLENGFLDLHDARDIVIDADRLEHARI